MLNKGCNMQNNLRIKDEFQCTDCKLRYRAYTFFASPKDRDNLSTRKMAPPPTIQCCAMIGCCDAIELLLYTSAVHSFHFKRLHLVETIRTFMEFPDV